MQDLVEIGKDTFDPGRVLQPSEPVSSELESLFTNVARAIDQQDFRMALRLADRARRIAARTPACNLLYARLLIKAGFPKQALDHLKDEVDPHIVVVRGIALLEQGLVNKASECCRDLLKRFSVDAVEGLSSLASQICQDQGGNPFFGWVGVNDELNLTGEARRGSRVDIECFGGNPQPIRFQDGRDGWVSFVCSLPAEISGPVLVRADDSDLLGSGFSWPPEFKPSLWVAVKGDNLIGEAQLGWSPKLSLTLELSNSDVPAQRTIMTRFDPAAGSCSFLCPLLPSESAASQLEVAAILPDGRRMPLIGSPLASGRRLAANFDCLQNQTVEWPPVGGPRSVPGNSEIIDIIVPVYAGRQETLDCLERVLRTTGRDKTEIVVVNDASEDLQLCEALACLANDNQITLITNLYNLGFAGTVNRGTRLHVDRDVILLNSDTQVFGDWIDRLRMAASKSANIGTVTALGQGGSITDYPLGNSLTATLAEKIDHIAGQANAGRAVDIPVGVGFCMYIKRICLNQTGELDAATFGRGYGEENDFCLRARKLGWRHVAATDVFIGHHGGRSFGQNATVLKKRNSHVLDALYPGYTALIEEFCATDPLFETRRAIDMGRLLAEASYPVLLITHDLLGGVKRHIREREVELSAAGHTVIILQRSACRDSTMKVSLTVDSLGLSSLVFDTPKDLPLLDQLFHDIGLSHVELHHFLRLPHPVLQIATQLNVSYDAYIHDYSWICPRVALIGGSGRYCGEPVVTGCEECIRNHGSAMEEPLTVSALRERSAKLLKNARKVFVPSTDARERLARYFPEQEFATTPWEAIANHTAPMGRTQNDRVRVAVIGAIGIPKGYEVLLDCARDAAVRNLNLDFVVIGYTGDDQPLLDTGRVFITGPYEENEVGMLLDREDCDVAFFPSVSPETWCYSLTHAITRSLPIVAFNIGAQAERLRTYPAAELLLLSFNAQQVNFALLQLNRKLESLSERQNGGIDQLRVDEQQRSLRLDSQDLVSSVQALRLPEGIYSFTVKEGGSLRDADETIALPALQVAIAPVPSSGSVEFLTGAATVDRWLAYRTDMVVIRILGGDGSLLLTSVQKQDSPSLAVDVERLNAHPSLLATQAKDAEMPAGRRTNSLTVHLMAHIRYVGDLDFDAGCAGWPGQKMWIEGFAISAIEGLPVDCIEYRGLVANGLQTPWLGNQALCGSRGGGLPLLGYAVRPKPAWTERYECAYIGIFFSGAKVGPLQNGALCSSDLPGDPLEAIEIRMLERQTHSAPAADLGARPVYG